MTLAPTASPRFDKLKQVLEKLFQFDQADLDFGIYRIMNAKRDEIRRFLDADLLPQVQTELGKLAGGDRAELERELADAIKSAQSLGVTNVEELGKVKELRAKLALTTDLSAAEADIYNDLANFFRRYYQNGDFLSLRRYKKDVYAIPYEGEEVKLHWANADQYYVKSSEAFRDYTFHLPDASDTPNAPDASAPEPRHVHFRLVDADTEANNNKVETGKERRFILADPPLEETNGELSVRFSYRVSTEKQAKLNADAASTILAQTGFEGWLSVLRELRPTEKNPKRTLLDKQLADYTAKNSFDYFVHKDLSGFLRRELDFFIKNEVLQLDDLETDETRALAQLARVKAMRSVAHKLIEMLAQLENFQKKLWLKKKFVVATEYCVTLDKVIENAPELMNEIAQNEAQRSEWVRLFAIDALTGDPLETTPGYSEPLTEAFLTANPFLVLDTRFFSASFRDKLLAGFDDLDAQTDGLLIKSENFQALNLLQARYKERVKCIYIDPPYNTGGDGFAYKDNYQRSSWLSMVQERVVRGRQMLSSGAVFLASIDDFQQPTFRVLLDDVFGVEQFVSNIVWSAGRKNDSRLVSNSHEYLLCYTESREFLKDQGVEWRTRKEGLNLIYQKYDQLRKKYGNDYATMTAELKVWFRDLPDSEPAKRHKHYSVVDQQGVYFPDNVSWPGGGGPTYDVFHPVTKQKVKVPTRGWLFPNAARMQEMIDDGRIHFGPDETYVPAFKSYLKDRELEVLYSVFYQDGRAATKRLRSVIGQDDFGFPKDETVLSKMFVAVADKAALIMDYFAGSGTAGHAVINLNREDGGCRKYILVEMGEYFDSVLKPRIQKVVYSRDWRDGKPVSREGSSQMVKVLRLESYEDALNNLEIRQPSVGAQPLDFSGDAMKDFREDYLLHYMLDVETRGSGSLLNLDRFQNPFNYELRIASSSAGETRPTKVDLVETFNYLLGLRVKTTETMQGFRVVTGSSPAGERVLVIWRNLHEKDNAALDAFFDK